MNKLQVKTEDGSWAWVFCRHMPSKMLQTCHKKSQALPSKAVWADEDLAWFEKHFPDREFRLAGTLEATC